MKKIVLSKGKHALVDDEDYDFLMQWKWSVGGGSYALRSQYCPKTKSKRTVYMHRELLCATVGVCVDHVNGDVLDNRRSNLRIASQSQNMMNARKLKIRSSRYKGVSYTKSHKKWAARIQVGKKYEFIGYFDDEESAASAYNSRAKTEYGRFCRINVL